MTFLYWAPESIILLDEQGPSNADQMKDEGFHCAVSIFWEKGFHNNNPQNRKNFEKFIEQVRRFFQYPLHVSGSTTHIEVSANNRFKRDRRA